MQFGYLTGFSVEQLITAREIGFDALEVHAASWQAALEKGGKEIKQAAAEAKVLLGQYDISISALALYGNYLAGDPAGAKKSYRAAIELAKHLGVKVIATICGRQPDKSIADNMPIFKKVFGPIAQIAEDAGVCLAFENWPGGMDRAPYTGVNIAVSPQAWEMMFEAVPSTALGLEFDPSHLYWQEIDYIAAAQDFASRIYHVHAKDTEIDYGRLAEVGYFGGGWWRYRIPGFGEIDWAEFISTLSELGYDGGIAIEHEDPIYSGKKFKLGLQLGYNHLAPLIGTN
jgi:sugar phosphate isomerase/epimerase